MKSTESPWHDAPPAVSAVWVSDPYDCCEQGRAGDSRSLTLEGAAPVVSRNATYLANIAFRKTRIRESLIDMLTLRSG